MKISKRKKILGIGVVAFLAMIGLFVRALSDVYKWTFWYFNHFDMSSYPPYMPIFTWTALIAYFVYTYVNVKSGKRWFFYISGTLFMVGNILMTYGILRYHWGLLI